MPTQHGPWQILESHAIYQDPWIKVQKDDVIRPDGKPGTHSVVTICRGVSVLLMDHDRNVYLTDEFHYAVGRNTLEVVSGGLGEGEEALAGAKREALEELGITAGEWIPLGSYDPFTTMLNAPSQLFLARGLSFGESSPDGTENIRCVQVTFEQALEMVMNSVITHGPSCTVILKAKVYLDRLGGK